MSLSRPLVGSLVMSLTLAACGGPDATSNAPAPTVAPAPASPPATAGSGSMPAASAPAEPVTPRPIAADPPALALQPVARGLVDPISIAPSLDGRLLVNERGGRVIAIEPSTGEQAVVLDLRDRVLGQGEQGLLGLALHPAWPDDARAFVHYSDRNGDTVLAEFRGTGAEGVPRLDAGSERVLLRVDQPFDNHNGGQLAFGPDGFLWVALGDGGSGADPLGNGQDAMTLLGSILRIDVDDVPDDGNDAIGYGIPADNPFVDGAAGAPEVFLYGLRNPWRFSFDRATDRLWIADVGQNAFEEINRLDPVADAGANLGWPIMEASHCHANGGCSSDGLVLPIAEYGRDRGCSVTGGYVYRGDAIPELTGWYLFADYCSGTLFGVPSDVEAPVDGSALAPRVLLESDARIVSFGEAADGELYLADLGAGVIYRVVPAG